MLTNGWRDKHDEANSHFLQLCEHTKKEDSESEWSEVVTGRHKSKQNGNKTSMNYKIEVMDV